MRTLGGFAREPPSRPEPEPKPEPLPKPKPKPEPPPEPAPLSPPLGVIEEPEEVTQPEGIDNVAMSSSSSSGEAGIQETIQPQRKTSYEYDYAYAGAKPHAPSAIGPIQQGYDATGTLVDTVNTLPPAPGKRRQLVWDEENRLACNQDHNRNQTVLQDPSTCTSPQQPATVRYYYDDQGTRVVKIAGPQHIYPNQHFSERNGTGFKHIYVGETRLLTKTVKTDDTYENHVFYFHPDHLGSSGYVTDEHSNLTEHLEYFASGETWVNEHPAQPTPVPYQYGAKELDEETGLYYFGARYYNPRTSLWQTPDPALPDYLDGAPNNGVFAPVNLALYTYAANNPVKFIDPNGLWGLVGHQHTPHSAALAVGFSPAVAREIGRAAWAPDTDDRSATHPGSVFGGAFLNNSDQRVIHLLTGGNAAATQQRARQRFQEAVDNMDLANPRFNRQQENVLHGFGDSFSHVDLTTADRQGCPCMYEAPTGHASHGTRPDDPNRNQGQYRQYLEGLYDVLSTRAQRENLKPRMTRDEFVDTMMRDVAGVAGDRPQLDAAQAIITRMEAQSP